MNVGDFTHDDRAGLITGHIRTKTLEMPYVEMHFIPEQERGINGPAYELMEPNVAGKLAPVGSLWERPMQDGRKCFCGFIDDEVAKEEKQVAFFPKNNDDGFDVVWRRGSPQFNGGGNRGGRGGSRGNERGGGQYRSGGFSGGSTAGPSGEYVGPNGGHPLDDDVPF